MSQTVVATSTRASGGLASAEAEAEADRSDGSHDSDGGRFTRAVIVTGAVLAGALIFALVVRGNAAIGIARSSSSCSCPREALLLP